MTLPKRKLLTITMALTSLVGSLYAASSTILLSNLKQAEEQHTRQAVAGVLNVFTQTQSDFTSYVADWSEWDDTYAFVEDPNKDYIQSNLVPEALGIFKLNLVLFIQPSGRIVFGTGFDLKHRKYTPIPKALRAHLSPNDLLLRHSNTESSVEGIVLLPEGPILISSRPILTTKGEGPIRGTLIFGRSLNADEIARLSKITRLSITVHGLNQTKLPPDFQAVRDSLSETNVILVRTLSDKIIAGYTLLQDIYGKPSLLLRVDIPREIYKQGQNSLRYLIASLSVMGLVFGGVTLLLVQQLSLSERQRQQSEKRYRTVFAQAAEGIFLVDADTKRILETNTAFEKLLAYTSAAVCQLTVYDVDANERESIDRNGVEPRYVQNRATYNSRHDF